jgi:hypothetical protein
VRADDALISWAAKQKLYFNDLLSPQAAAAVAALLEGQQPAAAADAACAGLGAAPGDREAGAAGAAGAGGVGVLPLAERKGLVEMLRQLSSVVQPDRCVLGRWGGDGELTHARQQTRSQNCCAVHCCACPSVLHACCCS